MTSASLDISDARKQFNRLDEILTSGARIIKITRHGKEAFAVIDLDYLQTVIETIEIFHDPEALKMLVTSLEDIRLGRLHDHEDVKRELM